MKQLLWLLLCVCTLNATAKTNDQEILLNLFEPMLLLGYQAGLDADAAQGSTPERNACVYAVTQKLGTPAVVREAMKVLKTKGLSQQLTAVTQFLSQNNERSEYVKNRTAFDRLLQARKLEQAEDLWLKYYQDTAERMPKQTASTLLATLQSVGEIDFETAIDNHAFEQEFLSNPACADYLESE